MQKWQLDNLMYLICYIKYFNQKLAEVANEAEKLIALVERQALLEALIQAIVNNFDLDEKSKLSNVSSNILCLQSVVEFHVLQLLTISDQLNLLIKDQSHLDILLMYLMKKYHGPQGVLNVLAEKHKACWEPLNFLKQIKEKLKVCITRCLLYLCIAIMYVFCVLFKAIVLVS